MNKFLRYLGIILVLLGVLVLALYYFGMQSNFTSEPFLPS